VKIEIELPDWVEGRHIRIFAGIEEVARRLTNTNYWEVKTDRCNMCGACCKCVPEDWPYGVKVVDGERWCEQLRYEANEYLCGYGDGRPFLCCHGGDIISGCNIKWEKVE